MFFFLDISNDCIRLQGIPGILSTLFTSLSVVIHSDIIKTTDLYMLLARTQWPIYFAHNKNLERPDSTVPYVITRKLLLQLV